ncbi:MAG: lysozyme inhibitor LprI family protein [Magnetospirillum sp.]
MFQKRWSQGEPAVKLQALLAAAEKFAQTREAEVDQTGTLRGALVIAAEEEIRDLLIEDLNAVVGLDPKLALAATDSQADGELNRVYKRVMAYDFGHIGGEPKPEGIRKVQRAWVKYRDAWLDFVKVARPEISPQAMANWQTRHRIGQLRTITGDAKP